MSTAQSIRSESAAEESQPRRTRVAVVAMMLFCMVGIGIALDLVNIYVASRTDPDFQSFCAVSDGINCTSVALSDYSTVLNTPVAVWAVAGYLFAAFLAGMTALRRKVDFGLGFLFIFGCIFTVVSIWLIVLMAFVIHSLCILCLAIDIINLTFLGMSIFAVRTADKRIGRAISDDFISLIRHPLRFLVLCIAGFGVLGAAAFVGPRLMPKDSTSMPHADSRLAGQQCSGEDGHMVAEVQRGVSPDGHPWVGSANPSIEIHEFTDYECPFCRKAHMMVRQMVSTTPGVRVYHRHYPLDNACNPSIAEPFHARACELSRAAVCAQEQGRFWEMNDLLFQQSDEIRKDETPVSELAARLELDPEKFACCMTDETRFAVMKADIDEGIRLGLKGTPAFIINGNVYYGKIPPEVLATRDGI
ncbi:MAG TPA: thioredoxin domain-containing protein [Myxococcota bacterium]|nr:thioredoxin domain-containing protein [Myxococcota bacterium]HQP94879.1 thioredoxin domain-containing protein [Myxococcota bacterium]